MFFGRGLWRRRWLSYQDNPCFRGTLEEPAPSQPETQSWHLLSFFTYFNTAHSRVKMENKNENKAKLRTTACTTKDHAREKAELLCLRQGWTLNVLLEAENDNTTGKVNLSSPCSHNILKTQQKTKKVLNSKCRIFQHDSIISHFRSAITVL